MEEPQMQGSREASGKHWSSGSLSPPWLHPQLRAQPPCPPQPPPALLYLQNPAAPLPFSPECPPWPPASEPEHSFPPGVIPLHLPEASLYSCTSCHHSYPR